MTIIVADDLGEEIDANSYVDVEEAEDILINLGFVEVPCEVDYIMATKYIDTYLRPVSQILNREQPLNFPRQKFKDSQGRTVTGIPKKLKEVTALIATEFMEDDLWNAPDAITEEAFGDSRVKYAGPTKQNKKPHVYLSMLKTLGYGSSTNSIELIRA